MARFDLGKAVAGLPWLRVAVIGGPDAGKSTLVAAITARQADRSLAHAVTLHTIRASCGGAYAYAAETAPPHYRTTIRPFLATVVTESRVVAFVDCPGDRLTITLPYAGSCDAMLVVVDVAAGFHRAAAADAAAFAGRGIAHVIVALVGEVSDTVLADAAELEARAVLGASGDDAVVCRSLDDVIAALDRAPLRSWDIETADVRADVMRSYSITGRGTVAIVYVERGTLRVNAAVAAGIYSRWGGGGSHFPVTQVTSLRLHQDAVAELPAGSIGAALVRGVPRYELNRGAVLLAPPPTPLPPGAPDARLVRACIARVSIARPTPPRATTTLQLYARTVDVTARFLAPVEDGPLLPWPSRHGPDGTAADAIVVEGRAHLAFHRQVPLEVGDRFTLLENRAVVGGGVIDAISPLAPDAIDGP